MNSQFLKRCREYVAVTRPEDVADYDYIANIDLSMAADIDWDRLSYAVIELNEPGLVHFWNVAKWHYRNQPTEQEDIAYFLSSAIESITLTAIDPEELDREFLFQLRNDWSAGDVRERYVREVGVLNRWLGN
ncbi:MAG: hypothetical protein Q4D85_05690 [Corynebacterium sp.]|uniref:hypothetical protein n=1 Tax=Corynebacterium sp. TaxID=1720 RepID=UPI0026DD333E|nr:hypothetical protein [Corynebacterium sp.]MDO5098234.1 hypothetical protein [Corynebacterium sp.]